MTSVFSDNIMKYIGYIEIVVGLGLGLGPMVGAMVYPYLRYDGTMYFFGVLNLFAMVFCYVMIPSELNRKSKVDTGESLL